MDRIKQSLSPPMVLSFMNALLALGIFWSLLSQSLWPLSGLEVVVPSGRVTRLGLSKILFAFLPICLKYLKISHWVSFDLVLYLWDVV